MAKSKKGRAAKAARYRAMAAAPGQPRQQQSIVSQFAPKAAAATVHGFSLADEARNTAEHRKAWEQQGKLRAHPVVFVSAGVVEPLKELDQLGQDSDDVVETSQAQDPEQNVDGAAPVDGDTQLHGEQEPSFFIDTSGDQTLARRHAQPVAIPDPHSSGDDSSSSEDIVLFKGRNGARIDNAAPPVSDNITIQVQAVEKTVQKTSLDTPNQVKAPTPRSVSPPPWQLRGHDDEDAIFADYVANMSEDNEAASAGDGDAQRVPLYTAFLENTDLGGSDGDVIIADESDSDASDGVQDPSGDRKLGVFEAGESTPAADTDMADEVLARLLARQEELGLDDDELMLLVGNELGVLQSSTNKASHPRKEVTVAFKSERIAKTSRRGPVPSAREVADAFDDLDLMDWGRHNPSRKPKSKRGQPTFDISDSELEETLQATWKADRLRKRGKKQEREELRAQGLLGKNVDPKDPRVKYQTGMTLDQIKEDMRTFLCGTDENLTLPPMDASARKIIHELANKFSIKSKSAGHGETRRPSLYRTKRTIGYSEPFFEQVFARAGRRYFPRLDLKGKAPRGGGGGGGTGRSGRGVSHGAFTLKDGEVVGGGAPELDQANKGRAMLEKMGWSTGMALGSQDNKGILQPLASVVKRTKAGLG
ncbi:squalene synthetase-like protein [Diaporthe australafricana]|uniref:Protein SQS1 n=1 Tax=Diaporthe australafricana TaxID=127596 RepID=A0ABR3VY71_9PEZI